MHFKSFPVKPVKPLRVLVVKVMVVMVIKIGQIYLDSHRTYQTLCLTLSCFLTYKVCRSPDRDLARTRGQIRQVTEGSTGFHSSWNLVLLQTGAAVGGGGRKGSHQTVQNLHVILMQQPLKIWEEAVH